MNRIHVHLSQMEETAINVRKRHGKPAVLRINARQMLVSFTILDDHNALRAHNPEGKFKPSVKVFSK